MFCSECGKAARGKFCCHCGSLLELPKEEPADEIVEAVLAIDWETEVKYETLLRNPQVRGAIDECARLASKRMSAEQFLALCDKLVPQPVSLEGLAAIAQPLWAKLGVRTGKEVNAHIDAPLARVMVRTLCSLARRGQPLKQITQGDSGCSFEAELPSDMFSMAGSLHVTLWRTLTGTGVSAGTRIEGQLIDWGKSRRCLDRLLGDLRQHDPIREAA